jgi:hypothetical protein
MKMRYSLILILVMLPLLPLRDVLSSSPLLYMFGHGSLFHYLVNASSLLLLWRLITPSRLLVAWLCSVAAYWLPSVHPVIGSSLFVWFFIGMLLTVYTPRQRWRLLALLLLSFFLPHIAALHHAALGLCGFTFRKIELRWQRTR